MAEMPDPPSRDELATRAWVHMQDLVLRHDHTGELRDALGLGRGAGRVRILLSLAEGPMSVGQLAEAIGADAPYATLIVNELVARGMLDRTVDPQDRRRKLVELTDAGVEALHTAQAIINRPPPMIDALGDDEVAQLAELLSRLQRADRPGA